MFIIQYVTVELSSLARIWGFLELFERFGHWIHVIIWIYQFFIKILKSIFRNVLFLIEYFE